MSRKFVGQWLLNVVFCAILVSLAGCGGESGPKREYAEVTGKVTYKGEAVKTGQVMFQPASGAPEAGEIKADGTYSLKAVLGPNTVMIISREAPPANVAGPLTSVPAPKSFIPAAYGTASSGLTSDVKKGTNKDVNFDLK